VSADFGPDDHRGRFPRFQGENLEHNHKLAEQLQTIAQKKGCTGGQLSIGWVLALSKQPGMPKIIPIPGASKAERVTENAKVVELTPEEFAEINKILDGFEVKGLRYPAPLMSMLNV
jgi:pyridoxine 4-dehydrogenase